MEQNTNTAGPWWQVWTTVIHDGTATHSPTYYLHANVQGITKAEHAARVAWNMAAAIAPKGARILARAVDAQDGTAYNVNTDNRAEIEELNT